MIRGFVDKKYGLYFKLPLSWTKIFKNLTDTEIGRLMDLIADYAFFGSIPDFNCLNAAQKIAFEAMRRDIDFQFEHPRSRTLKDPGQNYNDRHCPQYQEWRNNVFERDNYTCAVCNQHGGQLNAHHIKPFAHFPELRFDVNNGITLCVDCHRKAHKRK